MNRGSGVGQHAMVEHKECQLEPVGYADLIEDSPQRVLYDLFRELELRRNIPISYNLELRPLQCVAPSPRACRVLEFLLNLR